MSNSLKEAPKKKKTSKGSIKKYINNNLKIKTDPLFSLSKINCRSVTTTNYNNNLNDILSTDNKHDKPLYKVRNEQKKRCESYFNKNYEIIEKNKSALSEFIINTSFNRKNRFKCINIKLLGNPRYRHSSPLLFVEDQKNGFCNTSLGLIPIPFERVRKKNNNENCKEEEKNLYELQRSIVMSRRIQYNNDKLKNGIDKINFNENDELSKNEDDSMNKLLEIQKWWKEYNGQFNPLEVTEKNMERIEYFKAFNKLKNFMLVKNIKNKISYISKDKYNKKLIDKIVKIQNFYRLYKAKILRKKLEDKRIKVSPKQRSDNIENKNIIFRTNSDKNSGNLKSNKEKIHKRPLPQLKNTKYKYSYSNNHSNNINNNFCYISKIVVRINLKIIKNLVKLQKVIKSYLLINNKLSKKGSKEKGLKENNYKNNSRISLTHMSERQNELKNKSTKINKDNNGFYITKVVCKSSENDILKIQRLIRENIIYNSQIIKKPNLIYDKNSFDSKTVKNNSIDNDNIKMESESSSYGKMKLYYNTETDKNLMNNISDSNDSNFESLNNNHSKNIYYITKNRKIDNAKRIQKIQNLYKIHLNSQNSYAFLSVYQVQKGKCCFISKNRLIKFSLEKYKYFIYLLKLFFVKNSQEYLFKTLKNISEGKNETIIFKFPFYIRALIRIQKFLIDTNQEPDNCVYLYEIFKCKNNNISCSILKNICYLSIKDKKLLINTNIFPFEDKEKLINFLCCLIEFEGNFDKIMSEKERKKFLGERLEKAQLKNTNIFSLLKFIDTENENLNNGKYCKQCYQENNFCKCSSNSENDDKSMEDDFQTLDIDLDDEAESLNIKKKINYFDYTSNNNQGNTLIKTKFDKNNKKLLDEIIAK